MIKDRIMKFLSDWGILIGIFTIFAAVIWLGIYNASVWWRCDGATIKGALTWECLDGESIRRITNE